MIEFPHSAPKGYHYEIEPFKRNVVSIWIVCDTRFDYNLGDVVRSIWGFYNTKTREYHSPVNSKTVGKIVDFDRTTPYSAIIPNLNPLTSAFV